MKKITIIGTGYVGLVSGTGFADIGHQVICADIDEEKIAKLNNGIIPIYEPGLEELVQRNREAGRLHFTNDMTEAIQSSDILFIAVGTPMLPSGEADLSYVRSVAEMIGEAINGYKIVVNKSTVPVGTGKLVREIIQRKAGEKGIAFDVVSNPEFLREGTAIAISSRWNGSSSARNPRRRSGNSPMCTNRCRRRWSRRTWRRRK